MINREIEFRGKRLDNGEWVLMREILFRGERLDNGEWVYGDLMTKYPHHEGLTIVEHGCVYHEVDPETVGQYTGLKDKNGVKIFEGDVVRDRWNNQYTPVFRNGTYMALNVEYLHLAKQEPSTQFNVVWLNGCEVVGCIHDNPELLEEQKHIVKKPFRS